MSKIGVLRDMVVMAVVTTRHMQIICIHFSHITITNIPAVSFCYQLAEALPVVQLTVPVAPKMLMKKNQLLIFMPRLRSTVGIPQRYCRQYPAVAVDCSCWIRDGGAVLMIR